MAYFNSRAALLLLTVSLVIVESYAAQAQHRRELMKSAPEFQSCSGSCSCPRGQNCYKFFDKKTGGVVFQCMKKKSCRPSRKGSKDADPGWICDKPATVCSQTPVATSSPFSGPSSSGNLAGEFQNCKSSCKCSTGLNCYKFFDSTTKGVAYQCMRPTTCESVRKGDPRWICTSFNKCG